MPNLSELDVKFLVIYDNDTGEVYDTWREGDERPCPVNIGPSTVTQHEEQGEGLATGKPTGVILGGARPARGTDTVPDHTLANGVVVTAELRNRFLELSHMNALRRDGSHVSFSHNEALVTCKYLPFGGTETERIIGKRKFVELPVEEVLWMITGVKK